MLSHYFSTSFAFDSSLSFILTGVAVLVSNLKIPFALVFVFRLVLARPSALSFNYSYARMRNYLHGYIQVIFSIYTNANYEYIYISYIYK